MHLHRLSVVLITAAWLSAGCSPQDADLPASSLAVAADCRMDVGCTVTRAGLTADLQFGAAPRALQPFPVSVKINATDTVQAVYVSFSMQDMDMGLNRYQLEGDAMSAWQGSVTLPICVSGRSDWIAEFEIVLAQRRILVSAPFVLSR